MLGPPRLWRFSRVSTTSELPTENERSDDAAAGAQGEENEPRHVNVSFVLTDY